MKRHLHLPVKLLHWQYIFLLMVVYDILTIFLSYFLVVWLRLDLSFSLLMSEYSVRLLRFLALYIPLSLAVYYSQNLYHSIWQFASYAELKSILTAGAICLVLSICVTLFTGRLPISAYVMGIIMQIFFACAMRFSYRFVLLMRDTRSEHLTKKRNTMVIGAGSTGQMLERDAKTAKESDLEVVCFIDDNPNKHNRNIDHIPVVGGREDILVKVKEFAIEVIVVAIPSATTNQRRDLLAICQETGCEIRIVPSLLHASQQGAKVNSLQKVRMEDLLGRDPAKIDTKEILNSIRGKTVLITGGGGSIGSELSRQIAAHEPKQLIIFDVYENNAYDIQQELRHNFPLLDLKVLIGSVRDTARLEQIFENYRPDIVYHAAAHKHVPLMETSPCESVKNNVFGTYKTARTAMKYGVERFVLISTDKAVNPTNIMGATKRLCEMIIQSMDHEAKNAETWNLPRISWGNGCQRDLVRNPRTQFVAVRFGNVLGSNGSVIPLFQKQINAGGPVTVTHPDIIRYFMTISEAVSLVLEAGSYAEGGEIFVLDMGEPVKIDDLARNLICLAGKVPGKDIEIEYTGLRPGEKLFEEKLMEEEGMKKTANELIHIGQPIEFDMKTFLDALPTLYNVAMSNDESRLIEMVNHLVTTYSPDWEHFNMEGIQSPASDSSSNLHYSAA